MLNVLVVMLDQGVGQRLVKDGGIGDDGSDKISIDVGGRSSVLDIALSVVMSHLGWDTEGGGTVANTIRELFEG